MRWKDVLVCGRVCVRAAVWRGVLAAAARRRSFARPRLTSCHCFHIRPAQLFRFVFVLEPRSAAAEGDLALQIHQVGSGGSDLIAGSHSRGRCSVPTRLSSIRLTSSSAAKHSFRISSSKNWCECVVVPRLTKLGLT